MPTNRGSVLAQTYQLPAPVQQQPIPQKQFQDEIGQPESGLQQIDGVTSEYFDKWSSLKGFARDVWENYGIDVRYPDPSVPESNKLHRIYLKAVADLKQQGERLKTGQKMYEADRQRGAIINKPVDQQYYDELNVGTDVVDAKLDPIVSEANNKLQQLYFGNAIEEAKQYYGQIKARLEQLRDTQPQQAGYWQRQLDSLTPPTKAVREFDPNRNYVSKGRTSAAGNFLKKIANMMAGTTKGYKISDTEFGPKGERVWVNKDFEKGVNYGGAEVVEWQFIPSTKESRMKVRRYDPTKQEYRTETVELSGQDALSVARTFVSENPRFSTSGEYLDQFADQNGYFSDEGEVNPNVLLTPDSDKIYEGMSKTEKDIQSKQVKAKRKTLEEELDSMEPKPWYQPDDAQTYTGKDGRKIRVAARKNEEGDGKVYEIVNIKELYPGKPTKWYSTYKKLSKDKIRNVLINYGALETLDTPPGTKPATKPTNSNNSPTVDPDI